MAEERETSEEANESKETREHDESREAGEKGKADEAGKKKSGKILGMSPVVVIGGAAVVLVFLFIFSRKSSGGGSSTSQVGSLPEVLGSGSGGGGSSGSSGSSGDSGSGGSGSSGIIPDFYPGYPPSDLVTTPQTTTPSPTTVTPAASTESPNQLAEQQGFIPIPSPTAANAYARQGFHFYYDDSGDLVATPGQGAAGSADPWSEGLPTGTGIYAHPGAEIQTPTKI